MVGEDEVGGLLNGNGLSMGGGLERVANNVDVENIDEFDGSASH